MRLMFVYWKLENAGSAQTILNFARVAKTMGHEVVLHGPPDPQSAFTCSEEVESADAVVFVFEWNIYLHQNKPLDIDGPVRRSARERRIIIDNDGMYSEPVHVNGDYNHRTAEESRRRMEFYDQVADRIFQPTYHPRRSNVGTYLFHGYDPAWERPFNGQAKEYGMYYVGSNWFRWRAMQRVLQAIEPIRHKLGRIGVVGHDWAVTPWWIELPLREEAYHTDPEYFARLGIEVKPAVPINEVIDTMSRGTFNPVLVRPTFNHLRLVNPRLFETPAASTIPLFNLDREYVCEMYGPAAGALVLDGNPTELIEDVLSRPAHYVPIVQAMRRHLAEHHSYTRRIQELIEIIQNR